MAYQTLNYPSPRPTGVQNIPLGVDLQVVPVQCGNYTSGNAPILVGDIMVDVGIYCGNNNSASANCVPGNATTWGNGTPGNASVPANATGLCGSASGLILSSGKTLQGNANCQTGAANSAAPQLQNIVHDAFMGVSTTYRDPTQVTQGGVRDEIGLVQNGVVAFTLVGNSLTTPGVGNGTTLDNVAGAIGAGGNSYGANNYCAVVGMPVAVACYFTAAANNNASIVLDNNNLPCVEILGANNSTQNLTKYSIGTVAKPVLTGDTQVYVQIDAVGGINVFAA